MRVFVTALFGLVIALLGYHGTEQLGGVKASKTPVLGRFWPSPPILHLNLVGKNIRWFSFNIWNKHNELKKVTFALIWWLIKKITGIYHHRQIINETLSNNHKIFLKTTVQFIHYVAICHECLIQHYFERYPVHVINLFIAGHVSLVEQNFAKINRKGLNKLITDCFNLYYQYLAMVILNFIQDYL